MSKHVSQRSILTANRLRDGTAVFLDFEGAWNENIAEAAIAHSPDELRALEDRGAYDSAHNVVVEPYLIEVREVVGRLEPIRYRERVRAGGPTILENVPGYLAPASRPSSVAADGQSPTPQLSSPPSAHTASCNNEPLTAEAEAA
jgi:hypothetical protein